MTIEFEGLTMNQLAERNAELVMQNAELQRKVEALAVENAALKETFEHVVNPDNQPEYHDQGMGCGVEDRGYQRDGYAACYYGWESAMERVYSEVIPSTILETPATDAELAEIRAQGIDMFSEMYANESIKNGDEGWKSKASNAASDYAQQLRKEAGK